MQFLKISQNTTQSDLINQVGRQNLDSILALNGLTRTPQIGASFRILCDNIVGMTPPVGTNGKIKVLNTFTSDADIFEEAAMSSETQWTVLSAIGAFPNALRVPETIKLPDSTSIIGGKAGPVDKQTYYNVINSLSTTGSVSPSIFTTYSQGKAFTPSSTSYVAGNDMYRMFNFPWGKIQLYSSLADDVVDFPVYPEDYEVSRTANYTSMPDIIYQYEPWVMYTGSGPRVQQYVFNFHRDMWSGNHMDGKAIQLIRFCEANCFPKYEGAAVNSAIVKMLIDGKVHCSGVMLSCNTSYSGPVGHDGEKLFVTLTLQIQEVSENPLNFDYIRTTPVLGR